MTEPEIANCRAALALLNEAAGRAELNRADHMAVQRAVEAIAAALDAEKKPDPQATAPPNVTETVEDLL